MGKRLSKIYTKTGDGGDTGLGDGSRLGKDHKRIHAIGSCDELNSYLGLVIEELKLTDPESSLLTFLGSCQHRIFDLGGEISIPGYKIINEEHVTLVEQELDELNKDIPPLDNFIMPAGNRLIAVVHLARSIARRAERDLVDLSRTDEVNVAGLKYLNRLSDYLFVLARFIAKQNDIPEVLWQKG